MPYLVIRFRQAPSDMSDKSQVVTSLLQLGESIGNFALQAGEVTKEMERAKKRCRLTTNFLKEHNEGREMLHKNVSSFRFHFLLKTLIYGYTKCEVKMAGYWLNSFLACFQTETDSSSINLQKTNETNISSKLDPTSLVNKGFIPWKKKTFSRGILRVIPSGKGSAILSTQTANHSVEFGSSCLVTELAIKQYSSLTHL